MRTGGDSGDHKLDKGERYRKELAEDGAREEGRGRGGQDEWVRQGWEYGRLLMCWSRTLKISINLRGGWRGKVEGRRSRGGGIYYRVLGG